MSKNDMQSEAVKTFKKANDLKGLQDKANERPVISIPVDAIIADWSTNKARPEGEEGTVGNADWGKLQAAMATYGQRTPVIVTDNGDNTFNLVAGFRRYSVAVALSWPAINAVIIHKAEAAFEQALENLDPRSALSLDGKAQTFAALMKHKAYTVATIAGATGEAEDSIRDYVAFATAPDILREAVLTPATVSGLPKLGWAIARVLMRDLRREGGALLDLPASIAVLRGMTFAEARKWLAGRGIVKNTAKMRAAAEAQKDTTEGEVEAAANEVDGADKSVRQAVNTLLKYLKKPTDKMPEIFAPLIAAMEKANLATAKQTDLTK